MNVALGLLKGEITLIILKFIDHLLIKTLHNIAQCALSLVSYCPKKIKNQLLYKYVMIVEIWRCVRPKLSDWPKECFPGPR